MTIRSILITAFIFCAFNGYTQNLRQIELFDLIKEFAPNSTMSHNAYDWFTGAEKNDEIDWKTNGIDWDDEGSAYRRAEAVVSIKGKTLECLGETKRPCRWRIKLKGSRAGYVSYSISSVTHQDLWVNGIENLVNTDKINYEVIEKCDNSASFGYKLYGIEIPGKKPLWLKYSWSCGSKGCSVILDCYTSERTIDSDCYGGAKKFALLNNDLGEYFQEGKGYKCYLFEKNDQYFFSWTDDLNEAHELKISKTTSTDKYSFRYCWTGTNGLTECVQIGNFKVVNGNRTIKVKNFYRGETREFKYIRNKNEPGKPRQYFNITFINNEPSAGYRLYTRFLKPDGLFLNGNTKYTAINIEKGKYEVEYKFYTDAGLLYHRKGYITVNRNKDISIPEGLANIQEIH